MPKPKLVRITTIPLSLEKLLEGQLAYMQNYYDVIAVSAEKERLQALGMAEGVRTKYIELTRKITPLKDISAVYTLYKFLKEEKPEIVHSHTPKAGIVGMLAAYFARVPHRLHTVAGLPLMEATGLKRTILNFVEKLTYSCATKVYPNSKGLKDFIVSENFTKLSKLKIIGQGSSNGIDTTYFSNGQFTEMQILQKKNELDIPESDFVFVFVGRLVKDKGINELVEAFVSLQLLKSDCTLLLVGPFEDALDPVLPKTKQCIEEHPKIKAVGFQQDVRLFFATSDALVFPSYREGFPNVVLQAGAMGLPAIVTDINGCNEIITNGENGLLVSAKETTSLSKSMHRVLTDQKLFETMKINARSIITKRYERKEIWQLLLEEYETLETNT
ncbi:glycosyltransferase family 4 protein [Rasiella sp. SM2506]|uniref:glycosyltransferase family 4 protein n=1 Tax=Rasiella sp. SM2506 TaxID=3423914 RepID=UPI003D7AD558